MIALDAKRVQEEARKEIVEERLEEAKEKLKDLYLKEEKASLVLKNIRTEITTYLNEINELSVYESAGVDVDKK